jgi:hypothetical protein
MIDLDVPETVATPFVVASAEPVRDPVSAARARVRHPLAADLLETPLVQLRTFPARESGYADLVSDAAWARSEDRGLLHKLTHHTVVLAHVPPVSQPGHGQAARAIARAVAEACGGVVYDGWSHQVLPHDFRYGTEHPEFCLADGWLATFFSRPEAPDETVRLTTVGLHRFALPELEAPTVPVANVFAAMTLLRCLSVTLVSEHWDWLACNPGARSRPLSRHAWAEGRDVWRYWAAEPRGSVSARVRVRFSEVRHDGLEFLPYLSVGPPDDFGAPMREWWNDVVDLAMPYVPEAKRRLAA